MFSHSTHHVYYYTLFPKTVIRDWGNSDRNLGLQRTWGQALLELVGLVGVLQDKGVDEAVASDLELDLLGRTVALDAGSCKKRKPIVSIHAIPSLILPRS